MNCRYDRQSEDYLVDGEKCRHDEYGDPTNHCTARRTCANHIGQSEHTCARCIGRTRQDLRRIVELAPLMLAQAIGTGVDGEAANLAGPGVDPRGWSERRMAMLHHLLAWEAGGRITERQYVHARGMMEDDDDQHPYVVLTRWHLMFSEDYGHTLPTRMSVMDSGAYLERTLPRVAQDPEQDFRLFRDEIRKCRSHLEAVIRNGSGVERGAPCPMCEAPAPKLTRSYGHWCEEDECERIHYADESGDRWTCPRDRGHWWSEEDYRRWVADVYEVARQGESA